MKPEVDHSTAFRSEPVNEFCAAGNCWCRIEFGFELQFTLNLSPVLRLKCIHTIHKKALKLVYDHCVCDNSLRSVGHSANHPR